MVKNKTTIISEEMAQQLKDLPVQQGREQFNEAIERLLNEKLSQIKEHHPTFTLCNNAINVIKQKLDMLCLASGSETPDEVADKASDPPAENVTLHPAFARRIQEQAQAEVSAQVDGSAISELRKEFITAVKEAYQSIGKEPPFGSLGR